MMSILGVCLLIISCNSYKRAIRFIENNPQLVENQVIDTIFRKKLVEIKVPRDTIKTVIFFPDEKKYSVLTVNSDTLVSQTDRVEGKMDDDTSSDRGPEVFDFQKVTPGGDTIKGSIAILNNKPLFLNISLTTGVKKIVREVEVPVSVVRTIQVKRPKDHRIYFFMIALLSIFLIISRKK